ncbi:translation initiation factor 2 [Pseudomonas sp.]|uniref:translation initiation factor 2 n=1 Tax=Pseudomonas sp. TaxID=306 RepID=UPI00356A7E1D
MRPGPWSFLLALLLLPLELHAEQTPPEFPAVATAEQAQIDALKQRLAISEQQREALGAELQASESESVQLQRLRQENQGLKLQLKKNQAVAPQPLLGDQQQWLVVGAGAALLGVILGALLRGNRRSRREWIN